MCASPLEGCNLVCTLKREFKLGLLSLVSAAYNSQHITEPKG